MKLSTAKTFKLLEKTPTSRFHEDLEERVLLKYFARKKRLRKTMMVGGIFLITREPKVVYERMDWDAYTERLLRQSETQFSRKNRMQLRSFLFYYSDNRRQCNGIGNFRVGFHVCPSNVL
jgi:hypothetical protein